MSVYDHPGMYVKDHPNLLDPGLNMRCYPNNISLVSMVIAWPSLA